MARVLIASLSDVGRDPRVSRQVDALRDEHSVTVAAYGSPDREDVDFVKLTSGAQDFSVPGIFRMAANASLRQLRQFDTAYWRDTRFRAWRDELAAVPADIILVNDAVLLPAAFEAAAGAPVVFDAHEYAPTQHEELLRFRVLVAPLTRHICRIYLPRVRSMMVVSEGIGQLYGPFTDVQPVAVTNAPPFAAISPRPVDEKIRLIHFGGADPQRRLEKMVELMSFLDDRFTLDLFLFGGERYVRKLKVHARSDPRIEFRKPVPMTELVHTASHADVGVFLYTADNPQRLYTLPNKLFEFIQARLAVAIGPSPEMAKIVRRFECGFVSPTFEPRDLAELLNATGPEQLWQFKLNSDAAARVLNAEQNAPIIRRVVGGALSAPADSPPCASHRASS